MVPKTDHDFSQESWLSAVTGIAKLAIILVVALSFLFLMSMFTLEVVHETECPEDNSIEYEDCILPDR